MHHSILTELSDADTTSLEDVRSVLKELKDALNEAKQEGLDPEDYDSNEAGEMLFDGLTRGELEASVETVRGIYRARIKAATGR